MPYKPHLATAAPETLEVRFEITKAARRFAALDGDEWLQHRRAKIAALRRELEEIAQTFHELRGDCDPRLRSYVQKYSPDQPRVPAGNSDGGQWTSVGDSGSLDESSAFSSTHRTIQVRSTQL
jgi:hypothetical protein